MEYDYEGCEHIIEALYDFAIAHNIPVVQVDDELRQGYWQHKSLYAKMNDGTLSGDLKRHQLDVHVLDKHVRSELEKVIDERKSKGRRG